MIADYPYSENILNMLFSLTKGILLIDIRRIDESDRNMQVFARGPVFRLVAKYSEFK